MDAMIQRCLNWLLANCSDDWRPIQKLHVGKWRSVDDEFQLLNKSHRGFIKFNSKNLTPWCQQPESYEINSVFSSKMNQLKTGWWLIITWFWVIPHSTCTATSFLYWNLTINLLNSTQLKSFSVGPLGLKWSINRFKRS